MAVSQGGKAGTDEGTSLEGEKGVRPLDFSQPTKFTADLRRHLTGALNVFAEELSQELTAKLKCEVEIVLGEVTQDIWAAARSRLPAGAMSVGVQSGAPERALLLSVELPWVLQALECLLGGNPALAPAERRLSEIDWALTKGLIDTVIAGLSRTWEKLDGPALSRGELDLQGDARVSAMATEPTLSVRLESTIDGLPSTLSLLMPWASVEPFAGHLRAHHVPAPGPPAGDSLRSGLSVAQVLLRAEVGSVQMPIERMLKIVPGSVVELQEPAQDGVVLFAEEVSVGRGKPGRSGIHKAIKIEASDAPPARADTYAKLGRAELERARAHVESFAGEGSPPILRNIFVRVWAELGRTHMSLGGALELSPGGVVELDQIAEEPVELFANGVCFANGSLVVTPQGCWGIQVQALV